MTIRILIMGLPGSGKTTLAVNLAYAIRQLGKTVEWHNADAVRKLHNDWDFTNEGRIRQSIRMCDLASASTSDIVICDFVCPLVVMRENYAANFLIWVDTVTSSNYADTDQLFQEPKFYDVRVTSKLADIWTPQIIAQLFLKE